MSVRTAARSTRRADESCLDYYLRDISAFPLIGRDEEVELARRVRAGDQDALESLVRANLRFVVSIAKRYQNRGVALGDLINEGNLGLIRAIHKFDETKGIKFISYAVWWIRQAIVQALTEQGRDVRVPLNRAHAISRTSRQLVALRDELGREPTSAEAAARLQLTEAEVTRCVTYRQVSLDGPMASATGSRLVDTLVDERNVSPDERMTEHALHDAVGRSLAMLTPREARVIRLYFGFEGDEPLTLADIGARLGVSRERARQIKERAIERLRAQTHAQRLTTFLDRDPAVRADAGRGARTLATCDG